MILAAVSSVSEKMLYRNFKESSLLEVNVPENNYKNIKCSSILRTYIWGCQVQSIDDTFALAEVIENDTVTNGQL